MNWVDNIENIYRISFFVLSFGLSVAALEDLCVFPVAFQSRGLLSWDVTKLSIKHSCKGALSKLENLILNDKIFFFSIFLTLILSLLMLIFSLINVCSPLLVISLFFLKSLIVFRTPYGLDGADQMYLLVLFALSAGTVFGIDSSIAKICVFYVAGQLICSYFVSGITKLASPVWRNSSALSMIFGTCIYGNFFIYRLVNRHPIAAYVGSWLVILFESTFVLILFASPMICILLISIGIIFHLFNAVFMGLNGFLIAFLSAYPSLLYLLWRLNDY